MDIQALRWFQQVADGITVTEVSDVDRISQSGVSRALGRLETEVGAALLRRSGRVLRMTRAGASFKRYVDRMLHELDDGLAAVAVLADPATGTVAVAFQPSLGAWLVPDLVAGFAKQYPEVGFALRPARDEAAGPSGWREQTDVEITTAAPPPESARWRPLLHEALVLAVPADHRLAAGPLGLDVVAREPFVALGRSYDLRRTGDALCRSAGFDPIIAFEGDDLTTVTGFVAAGLGVAIVPTPHPVAGAGAGSRSWRVRYLAITDPAAAREIGIAWPLERRLLPAAENFRDYVIDELPRR